MSVDEKVCSRCQVLKGSRDFSERADWRNGKPRTGLRSWCKSCQNDYSRTYKWHTVSPPTKQCITCGDVKGALEFNRACNSRDGLAGACKPCRRAYTKEKDTFFTSSLKRRFGVTPEWYWQQYEIQGGRCGICMGHSSTFNRRLAVDHCHDTGRLRGLLCFDCNTSIGKLGDTVEALTRALDYLSRGTPNAAP